MPGLLAHNRQFAFPDALALGMYIALLAADETDIAPASDPETRLVQGDVRRSRLVRSIQEQLKEAKFDTGFGEL